LSPRMEVQYWISESDASDLEVPFPLADGVGVAEEKGGEDSKGFWVAEVDEDPKENGAAGFELEAAGPALDWPNENEDVDLLGSVLGSGALGSLDFEVSSDTLSSFFVSLPVLFCPKPKVDLGFSASVSGFAELLVVCPKPKEELETGAPNGEAFEVTVLGVEVEDPKPNVILDPVDGVEFCPNEVDVEVEGFDPDPKLNAGVEDDDDASVVAEGAGVAGLPNENPPNGLALAAAGAGAGAGVDEAPNVNPADGAPADGAADDA
jgi:hypothetical protein